jgi:hypothetical protein
LLDVSTEKYFRNPQRQHFVSRPPQPKLAKCLDVTAQQRVFRENTQRPRL